MSFRIAARTLIQLGAELISSDAVALYELVKNAFDAGSRRVTIEVVVRMPYQKVRELSERIEAVIGQGTRETGPEFQALCSEALSAIDLTAPHSRELRRTIEETRELQSLGNALSESNYLEVRDTGEGMSLETLNDVFLTIGTRSRLEARSKARNGTGRPTLGEKGLGRLSTMRLGQRLRVESSTVGEMTWNVLEIDWSMLSHDSDALLETFHVEPRPGEPKDKPSTSGTRIHISGLTSGWSRERLEELVRQEFTKLTDPFADRTVFPVQLIYNNEAVSIPRFNKLLLENAHAIVRARLERLPGQSMRLVGEARYKEREMTFAHEGPHLISFADTTMSVLESLGPFEVEVYWYNRRILTALEGIGDRATVLRLVREWGGGIMVFRDGFRVLPYGGPDDDWLDLDRRAFGSGGYKINRTQIVGRLKITSSQNPALTDQTNREGLRDCEEKRALILLLQHVLQSELRPFLDATDKEAKAREPIFVEELEERVEEEERQVRDNLDELERKLPDLSGDRLLIDGIRQAVERLRVLMTDVREMAASFEAGRGQLLNLAGIGLTVEVLAHELNRATEHALVTLGDISGASLPPSINTTMRTLESQLKTIQKRLRILDPLSTAGRQRKESFDVVALVRETVDSNSERFMQDEISCTFAVVPTDGPQHLRIRAVKGMVVQVVENLIINSAYWVRQQRRLHQAFRPEISVVVDTVSQEISVTDNGPGVTSELKERIFEAFFTTKPAGMGKGLGLFIAREIAKYHGAQLLLADQVSGPNRTHHTFVLTLEGMR